MTATIVVDLGFGDAGKGTIIDFLARQSEKPPVVVRFNGGAQAAHNVITPTGVHHTFSQFGAGSFIPGARTFLSRFMLVDPTAIIPEAEHLRESGIGDPLSTLYIDEDAMVVTRFHKEANRARERARGDGRHGSCGMGIGEAVDLNLKHPDLTIRMRDLRSLYIQDRRTVRILEKQRDWLADLASVLQVDVDEVDIDFEIEQMGRLVSHCHVVDRSYLRRCDSPLLFEGAQGVLLDENYGFHPYTTWSNCTFDNAQTLLDEINYSEKVERLGVLRSYMVRHGPGPFPTEDIGLAGLLPEWHNRDGEWQRAVRFGWFDVMLARYAMEVCGGIDALAITNIDTLSRVRNEPVRVGLSYIYHGDRLSAIDRLVPVHDTTTNAQRSLGHFLSLCRPLYVTSNDLVSHLDLIQSKLLVPIRIRSYGPTAVDKEVVS
jgi:adenylosuccinate synthase